MRGISVNSMIYQKTQIAILNKSSIRSDVKYEAWWGSNTWGDASNGIADVEKVFIHPSWEPLSYKGNSASVNIALLKLQDYDVSKQSDVIEAASIAGMDYRGVPAKILGWGGDPDAGVS